MKISDLMEALGEIQGQYGDLPVLVPANGVADLIDDAADVLPWCRVHSSDRIDAVFITSETPGD